MMQPTQTSPTDHRTPTDGMGSTPRGLLAEAEMGPVVMVIGDIIRDEPLEMALVQRNDLVEQLAPQLPTQRSATPFCQGLWIDVCTQAIAMDRIAAGTSSPYFAS